MLFALSADRSNSQSDFCGKGPLFLEPVTCMSAEEAHDHILTHTLAHHTHTCACAHTPTYTHTCIMT